MNDLISAISSHSHYEDDGDRFWETMFDKYWGDYSAEARRPNFKDFMIYCEEHNLVPDDEVFENV